MQSRASFASQKSFAVYLPVGLGATEHLSLSEHRKANGAGFTAGSVVSVTGRFANCTMLRRQPTRIELKLDDKEELKTAPHRQAGKTAKSGEANINAAEKSSLSQPAGTRNSSRSARNARIGV